MRKWYQYQYSKGDEWFLLPIAIYIVVGFTFAVGFSIGLILKMLTYYQLK